jgi:hypothetical protein
MKRLRTIEIDAGEKTCDKCPFNGYRECFLDSDPKTKRGVALDPPNTRSKVCLAAEVSGRGGLKVRAK